MPFVEQPDGYLPHPRNIRASCWNCGAGRRDITVPPDGTRKEQIFACDRYIPADDVGAVEFIGVTPTAGYLALCETCLTEVATRLGMILPATYADMAEQAEQAKSLEANLKVARAGLERVGTELIDFTNRLEWMTAERDTWQGQFNSLANLDRDSRDEAVVLREELAAMKVKLTAAESRCDNRDAVIDALRRGGEPPAVKRPPGRPRADATA